MQVKKEIISVCAEKEIAIESLLTLLSDNNAYKEELQKMAEEIAASAEEVPYV